MGCGVLSVACASIGCRSRYLLVGLDANGATTNQLTPICRCSKFWSPTANSTRSTANHCRNRPSNARYGCPPYKLETEQALESTRTNANRRRRVMRRTPDRCVRIDVASSWPDFRRVFPNFGKLPTWPAWPRGVGGRSAPFGVRSENRSPGTRGSPRYSAGGQGAVMPPPDDHPVRWPAFPGPPEVHRPPSRRTWRSGSRSRRHQAP